MTVWKLYLEGDRNKYSMWLAQIRMLLMWSECISLKQIRSCWDLNFFYPGHFTLLPHDHSYEDLTTLYNVLGFWTGWTSESVFKDSNYAMISKCVQGEGVMINKHICDLQRTVKTKAVYSNNKLVCSFTDQQSYICWNQQPRFTESTSALWNHRRNPNN